MSSPEIINLIKSGLADEFLPEKYAGVNIPGVAIRDLKLFCDTDHVGFLPPFWQQYFRQLRSDIDKLERQIQ